MTITNSDATRTVPATGTVVGHVVGHLDDLAVAAMKMVKVDGHRLCLVRTSEGVFALDQACPHEGYGLSTGQLDGDLVTCAWHNWKFRVSDGRVRARGGGRAQPPGDVADDGTLGHLRRPDPAERPKLLPASGAASSGTTSARCRATSSACSGPTPTRES
jgi:nitrite reductase/ring-hydroxylating ferredoxin subunit